MRYRKPFILFPRRNKRSRIWYYQTYDDNGNRTTARSTGQTSKTAANVYVTELLKKGTLVPNQDPIFKDYVSHWWRWDECPYVLGKRARGESKISQTYVDHCRSYLDHHILPYLGKYRVSAIKTKLIEHWLLELRKKPSRLGTPLSPTTVNQCLMTLKIIFREGVRIADLSLDPTVTVQPLGENRKEKSFLDPPEIKALFDESEIRKIWDGNLKHYTINLLAASTGMRMGECQGLQNQCVYEGYVDVRNTWIRKYGLKDEPKKGSKRKIPVPSRTQSYLNEIISISPYQDPEDLIFWGPDGRRPIGNKIILTTLYGAFHRIGVTEEERQVRNISFHSWRHFYNSFLRGKVADAKLQRLTGHRTQEMTEHYTSFRIDDFQDVLKIQEDFFERGKIMKISGDFI